MYFCVECGCIMVKADDETLICPGCSHSVKIEDYGSDIDEYKFGDDAVPDFMVGESDESDDEDDDYGEYYDPEIDE